MALVELSIEVLPAMKSTPPALATANVEHGPTEFEHAQARRMVAALDAAVASGVSRASGLHTCPLRSKSSAIRPRLAAIVAAGGSPVDAQGQPLYTV
jgi:hypothetical protein